MYHFIVALLQPFPWLILAVGVGTVCLWRSTTSRSRWLAVIGYALLVLDVLPAAAFLTAGTLEWQYPRQDIRPPGTRVIVVLGGGVYRAESPTDRDRMDEASLVRTVAAAELYHAAEPCPIILSGGYVRPEVDITRPAVLMAEFLRQHGVRDEDLIIESHSRNTEENARFTADILRQNNWSEGITLLTSATHLPRAVAFFRKEGVTVIPVGCNYRTDQSGSGPSAFWPRPKAAAIHQEVLHEWLGMAWGRLRGRL